MKLFRQCICKLQDQKAQILLPSVLLAPIFILVIYLLFETAKVSMYKIRNQFALDNAAYSQMSAASTYLNAVAMVNGPLPYRVMLYYEKETQPLDTTEASAGKYSTKPTIFDLFYKGGGVPAIGPDHEKGSNPSPKPESIDWDVRYSKGVPGDSSFFNRDSWQKENPGKAPTEAVAVMSQALVNDVYFPHTMAIPVIVQYLTNYAYVSSIYESQSYVYKDESKNAIMFREGYFLNVNDCKRSECARQSAAQLRPYLAALKTTPFQLANLRFFISDSDRSGLTGTAFNADFNSQELLGKDLFQFAYLDSGSLSKLRVLSRGILLKQPYKLPSNHFNINLEQKYKPYVRNRVKLSCPRASNNCVWPNPLPKYGISLDP